MGRPSVQPWNKGGCTYIISGAGQLIIGDLSGQDYPRQVSEGQMKEELDPQEDKPRMYPT
jgi:hypothetical protein